MYSLPKGYQVWHPKYGAVYQNNNWMNEVTGECGEENVGEKNEQRFGYDYISLCEWSV